MATRCAPAARTASRQGQIGAAPLDGRQTWQRPSCAETWSTSSRCQTPGSWALLEFEPVRPIGYVELKDGAVYLQDPDQIRTYTLVADDLQRVALGPDQSVALLESMLDH